MKWMKEEKIVFGYLIARWRQDGGKKISVAMWFTSVKFFPLSILYNSYTIFFCSSQFELWSQFFFF